MRTHTHHRRRVSTSFRPTLVRLQHRLAPATFTVMNLNDDGTGSLRRAVQDAGALSGADTITFDPSVVGTITLTSSRIYLGGNLSIVGPGASKLSISGGGTLQIFNTVFGSGPRHIEGLTLTNGQGQDPFEGKGNGGALEIFHDPVTLRQCVLANNTGESGGAIKLTNATGQLLMEDCVLTGNSASRGGAIHSDSKSLTIRRSIFTNNTAKGSSTQLGGGAISARSLVLENSTVANNAVLDQGPGGGIDLFTAQGDEVLLTGNTISGNTTATGYGGALTIRSDNLALAVVRNCTITGNGSNGISFGGDGNSSGTGRLRLFNCTITGNTDSANFPGGGIRLNNAVGFTPLVELQSTLIAGNTAPNYPGMADVSSPGAPAQFSGNNNLIGIMDPINNVTLTGSGNFTGSVTMPLNPNLGPLADNGGLTQTHALLGGSIAINNGNNVAGLTFDQRGYTRKFGTTTDIGAYESVTGIIVNNTNDSGAGSLRQAINDVPSGGEINFGPLFSTPQTITLSSGALLIDKVLSINGPGPEFLTLLPTGLNRILSIGHTPFFLNGVGISGMTFKNANHTGGASNRGGAIHILDEAVTISNCVFDNNTAGIGGAVYFEFVPFGGYLTIEDSRFINNKTTLSSGGAIHVNGGHGNGPVNIRRSLIYGNSAANFGGGGIFVRDIPTTIDNCTISGNSSATNGGGIHVSSTSGGMTIRNSTISNNVATGGGGGIFTLNSTKTLTIYNSTIVGNSAGTGTGGGIGRSGGTGAITIESTIVSGNTNAGAPDIFSGGTVNLNYSAVGDSIGFTPTGSNNRPFGEDLKLGPLANNGGKLPTHALLIGSPAINAGSNPTVLTTDERGIGYVRSYDGITDIGAFEVQPFEPITRVLGVQVNDGSAQRSRVTSLQITFDQPPMLPFIAASAFELKRQGDNAKVTLNAVVIDNAVTLTFVGGAVDFGSLSDGRYTLTIFGSHILNMDGDADGNLESGDDYHLVGDTTNKLFRLFGDADGNGLVNTADFVVFRAAFGVGSSIFDFDDDGLTNTADFVRFRGRFGTGI